DSEAVAALLSSDARTGLAREAARSRLALNGPNALQERINGLKHIDVMKAFNDDPDTDAVIMIGEIGGPDEAEAARWCKANMKKPIVGFIAGVTAPPGKRMGHAGALISGGADTADAKLAIMEECGFTITRNPSEMGRLLKGLL
uniref:cation-transporting P-type ATPase n=1 Tax=Diaphorobacter sp. TaxID=1934310 RepID=UPI0025875A17